VIVEVDPVWHALKGDLADRPLPPGSTSTVPVRQHASLIGRTSQSRSLRPEIALDADTAVSRRHAQLILEGDRLSVVDLSSTNGTYVVDRDAVPNADAAPIAAGVAAVLDDGDQIFLGAWSRLTVRRT
jgi:pSer/pThr/pTyr-binding forkhead associated (FHA) protein